MKKSINEKEQCVQTDVMQSVLLTEKDLIDLGFEIVRFKEPNYNIVIDRFWKLDYAIMRINKKIGNGDDLVIRFREGKFVLDGFYGVRFYKKQDILDLISCFTRSSQTVALLELKKKTPIFYCKNRVFVENYHGKHCVFQCSECRKGAPNI